MCGQGRRLEGKNRSKPPLSRNILSLSFVCRLAEGSMSRSTHRFSATSSGPEGRGLLEDERALTRRKIELLAIGVVAVLERLERLVVDLSCRHDPQHQTAPALAGSAR